jgi:hypothetical protein
MQKLSDISDQRLAKTSSVFWMQKNTYGLMRSSGCCDPWKRLIKIFIFVIKWINWIKFLF